MGQQNTEAGSNEAATFEDGRSSIYDGRIGEVLPRPEPSTEVPFFEESYSGSSSPELTVVPDAFKQVSSSGLPTFDGSLLALHLAARSYPTETCGPSAVQPGGSAQEGESNPVRQLVGGTLKVVRVLLNPNVLCYLNAVIQGVTWTSLGATCLDKSLWNDDGKLVATMSRPSPFPLQLPKHSCFRNLWNSWCEQVNGAHQHDVREFLDFLLEQLGPKFWGGLSSPLWACNDISAEGDAAKGARWMTVSFNTPQSEGTSLQHLIHQWHDEHGMKNGLMCQGRALALHLARYNGEDSSQKTYACINLPQDHIVHVPHLVAETEAVDSDFQVKWIQYSIVGLTWHAGPDTATGHYRTILRAHDRWMHYDDNKPPCAIENIDEHLLQRTTIIWMVLFGEGSSFGTTFDFLSCLGTPGLMKYFHGEVKFDCILDWCSNTFLWIWHLMTMPSGWWPSLFSH